jgi:hypothetical protein
LLRSMNNSEYYFMVPKLCVKSIIVKHNIMYITLLYRNFIYILKFSKKFRAPKLFIFQIQILDRSVYFIWL